MFIIAFDIMRFLTYSQRYSQRHSNHGVRKALHREAAQLCARAQLSDGFPAVSGYHHAGIITRVSSERKNGIAKTERLYT